jgi:nucleoside-diphosphate-sugar epimerase
MQSVVKTSIENFIMSEKKRVLITGGAGFLGSHLCDRFLAEGYHVIAMDNICSNVKTSSFTTTM